MFHSILRLTEGTMPVGASGWDGCDGAGARAACDTTGENKMRRTMIEVHGEDAGKKGALVFELEGGKEDFDEAMQAADQVIRAMADTAGKTAKEFTTETLRQLPLVSTRKDDPDLRRLMQLATLHTAALACDELAAEKLNRAEWAQCVRNSAAFEVSHE